MAMGWFPRAFGLLLLILAVAFVADLLWPDLDYDKISTVEKVCPYCIHEAAENNGDYRYSRCYLGPFNRKCPLCGAGWRESGLLDSPNVITMSLFILGVVLVTGTRLVSCGSCSGRVRRRRRTEPPPAYCYHCKGQSRISIWTWALS